MHLNVSDRAPLARSCANAALLALVALVPTGCGFGTSGVLGASGGSSGTTNSQAVASDLIAPRSATSPATVLFVLRDRESDRADVTLNYRDRFLPRTSMATAISTWSRRTEVATTLPCSLAAGRRHPNPARK
ncbi:MAG: hypothetical protein ACI8UD_001956 [Planctomycetota bacterium]|jgi:hypothetical protein